MSWTKPLLVAAAAALLLGGCSKSDPGQPGPGNLPPDTFLSHAPAEGDTTSYRVRMDWYGWDADGYVSHYRVRLDTLEWKEVSATESVFVLPAGAGGTDGEFSYEPHTVAVAAIDNHETPDPTPASVWFTASTVLPETEIIRAPPASGGPVASFEWLGSDSDGTIAGYEYRFSEWAGSDRRDRDWVELESSGFLGLDEVTVVFESLDGRYLFEVWSTDDVGAVDPTPAEWDFEADPAFAGPMIRVESNLLDIRPWHGPPWPEPLPISIFQGEHLTFTWWATAESYGGEVIGYRHAFDDTIPWPEWSLADTHFEVTPTSGTHMLYICAIDNSGAVSGRRVDLDVIEAPLDDYVLVVDDYDWWEHNPLWGSDDARDEFYELILADCARPLHEWEPSEHIEQGQPRPPDVEALSRASTVVWYTDGESTVLRTVFDPNELPYNQLAGYMRVGGNLILCGYKNMWNITAEPYPVRTLDAETQAEKFVRDYLHIDYGESSGTTANKSTPWTYGYCFYGAVPFDPGSFTPMYIDSVGTGGYPEQGKWPVYTWEQPQYSRGGLPQVEILSPGSETVPFLTMDAFLNTRFGGRHCGVLYLSGDNHANVCYFGFPLYYLQTEQVEPVVSRVLELFGEETRR